MNKPTMFSNPVKKYQEYPVYILSNVDTGKKYKSDLIPNHYLTKSSAEYMLTVLSISKNYNTVGLMYNPNEGTYEKF